MSPHHYFMQKALAQAQKALARDEVPIGAVIVTAKGEIIAQAYNRTEQCHTQTAHAELEVIKKAGKKRGNWRLEDCWLYVTLEPCAMCMNAIIISRLAGVVFGADSPLFGYHRIDNAGTYWLYKKDTLAIIGGVCKEQSQELLQKFFKQKRKRNS